MPVDAGSATAPAKATRSWRMVTLCTVAAVVLAGVAGGGWWLWSGTADAGEAASPEEGQVAPVDSMTVGLSDSDSHARLSYGIVMAEGHEPGELDERLPLMRDATLERVAAMTGDELRTPAGMNTLKERLAEDARDIFNGSGDDPVVLRVVLTELVVR